MSAVVGRQHDPQSVFKTYFIRFQSRSTSSCLSFRWWRARSNGGLSTKSRINLCRMYGTGSVSIRLRRWSRSDQDPSTRTKSTRHSSAARRTSTNWPIIFNNVLEIFLQHCQSKRLNNYIIFRLKKKKDSRTVGSIVPEEAWVTWQMSSFLQLPDGSQTGLGDHILVWWEELFQILWKKLLRLKTTQIAELGVIKKIRFDL